MTEESKVEVELHDEKINDVVEETLEEKQSLRVVLQTLKLRVRMIL